MQKKANTIRTSQTLSKTKSSKRDTHTEKDKTKKEVNKNTICKKGKPNKRDTQTKEVPPKTAICTIIKSSRRHTYQQ